jgi:hypothetical protein
MMLGDDDRPLTCWRALIDPEFRLLLVGCLAAALATSTSLRLRANAAARNNWVSNVAITRTRSREFELQAACAMIRTRGVFALLAPALAVWGHFLAPGRQNL